MESLFERIPEEKQRAVLRAAMEEFAERGYERASTNAIVRRIGISKGSLFTYFASKEALLEAVADAAGAEVARVAGAVWDDLPADLAARTRALAEIELDLYAKAPLIYRFYRRVYADAHAPAVKRLLEREGARSASMLRALVADAELPAGFAEADRHRLVDVLSWVLEGLGQRWFVGDGAADEDPTGGEWREAYLDEVAAYTHLILRGGTNGDGNEAE